MYLQRTRQPWIRTRVDPLIQFPSCPTRKVGRDRCHAPVNKEQGEASTSPSHPGTGRVGQADHRQAGPMKYWRRHRIHQDLCGGWVGGGVGFNVRSVGRNPPPCRRIRRQDMTVSPTGWSRGKASKNTNINLYDVPSCLRRCRRAQCRHLLLIVRLVTLGLRFVVWIWVTVQSSVAHPCRVIVGNEMLLSHFQIYRWNVGGHKRSTKV